MSTRESPRPEERPAAPGHCEPGESGSQCRARVFRWAREQVGNLDDADDLCQEVCLRCWSGRNAFRGESAFGTWLYRVMANALAEHWRTRTRQWESLADDAALLSERPGSSTGPATEAEQDEASRVRAALDRLTAEERQLLELTYFEELNAGEIAAQRGISVAAVWNGLSRARRAFRRAWARGGGPVPRQEKEPLAA